MPNPCIYCGAAKDLTNDHVPPKAAFPKPRPSDLITVPSCRSCNKSFEQDDEYFKHHLGIRGDIEAHPQAAALLEEVRRAWRRPEGGGLKAFVAGTFAKRDLQGKDGGRRKELGQLPDGRRLSRVLGRTVRGIYYHETGLIIPAHYRTIATLYEAADPEYQLAFEAAL